MAYKQKGFPMIKGVKMHKSALKEHMGIPKDKDPEGWSMYHTADGKPRPTEHVKQIVKLMNEGMSAKEAISAVGKRGSEIKEDDQSPAKHVPPYSSYLYEKRHLKAMHEGGTKDGKHKSVKKSAEERVSKVKKQVKEGIDTAKKVGRASGALKAKSPTKHGKRVTPVKHGRGRKGHVN